MRLCTCCTRISVQSAEEKLSRRRCRPAEPDGVTVKQSAREIHGLNKNRESHFFSSVQLSDIRHDFFSSGPLFFSFFPLFYISEHLRKQQFIINHVCMRGLRRPRRPYTKVQYAHMSSILWSIRKSFTASNKHARPPRSEWYTHPRTDT